jgi:hypothetical protein
MEGTSSLTTKPTLSRLEPLAQASREQPEAAPEALEVELELIESDAVFCLPALGADVVVMDSNSGHNLEPHMLVPSESVNNEELHSQPSASSGQMSFLQHQDLTRRVSYEEMVHEDVMEEDDQNGGSISDQEGKETITFEEDAVEQCLIHVTEWALTLQEVAEARKNDWRMALTLPPPAKCLCAKAHLLCGNFRKLEMSIMVAIEDKSKTEAMLKCAESVLQQLRTSVSIAVTRPNHNVSATALAAVAASASAAEHACDAVAALTGVVLELMGTTSCSQHPEGNSGDLASDEEETNEHEFAEHKLAKLALSEQTDQDNSPNRKRKKGDKSWDALTVSPPATASLPQPPAPPTSPTSSPSKRPRRGRLLSAPSGRSPQLEDLDLLRLLESKQKMPRTNGLRQFVMWREAFRAGKEWWQVAHIPSKDKGIDDQELDKREDRSANGGS